MKDRIITNILQLLITIIICFLAAVAVSSGITIIASYSNISVTQDVFWLKILQSVSQVFIFLVPPIFYLKLNHLTMTDYWGIKKRQTGLTIVFVCVLIFVALPVVTWLQEINQAFKFPDSMKSIENILINQEDRAEKVLDLFLNTSSILSLLGNIIVIALIPAISEEMLFRGCLQKIMTDKMRSYHLAIILSSLIFSAVHLQFYGLLPRFVLGLILGYTFYYTGNIFMSMIMHFLNNCSAVFVKYWVFNYNGGIEPESTWETNVVTIIFSIVITIGIILYFRKVWEKKNLIV